MAEGGGGWGQRGGEAFISRLHMSPEGIYIIVVKLVMPPSLHVSLGCGHCMGTMLRACEEHVAWRKAHIQGQKVLGTYLQGVLLVLNLFLVINIMF